MYQEIFNPLCCRHTTSQLAGQRVGVFSYGSGSAATLYSLRVTQDHTPGETLAHLVGFISPDIRLLPLLLFEREVKLVTTQNRFVFFIYNPRQNVLFSSWLMVL